MQHSAVDVAYYLINKGIDNKNPLTQLQLQLLTIISHGYYLAFNDGRSLIKETVEAWQFSPIVPIIYDALKMHGSGLIKRRKKFSLDLYMDTLALAAIDEVYDVYGRLRGGELITILNRPEAPWHYDFAHSYNYQGRRDLVSNKDIENYYKNILESV